jgi:hypothetical protein
MKALQAEVDALKLQRERDELRRHNDNSTFAEEMEFEDDTLPAPPQQK